jgi:hypothetical protein
MEGRWDVSLRRLMMIGRLRTKKALFTLVLGVALAFGFGGCLQATLQRIVVGLAV